MLSKIQKSKTPQVYSYVRFSTETQRRGTGQARQDDAAQRWCDERGYKLTQTMPDLGISAYKSRNATHGELATFLRLVEDGRIPVGSILIVESLDRLSRDNINVAMQLLLSIINNGIRVVTLADGAQYMAESSPAELMTRLMLSLAIFMRANDESRTKSMRKADSWKRKRQGARDEGKPLGGRLPRWIRVRKGKYELVESEANRVRQVVHDYLNGDGIYILKNRYNIPQATLQWWLTNPILKGDAVVTEEGQKVVIPKHYPPLIDEDTWEQITAKRNERRIGKHRGPAKFIHLFAGILVNSEGERFRITNHNKQLFRNLAARGSVVQLYPLEQHLIDNHLYHRLVEKRYSSTSDPEAARAVASLETKIKEVQERMSQYPDLFADLLPVLRSFQTQRDKARKEAKQITVESVSHDLVDNIACYAEPHDRAKRLRLRELVRNTVHRIVMSEVRGNTRNRLVIGEMTLHDGSVHPIRFAYDTRRQGCVSCDGVGFRGSSKMVSDIDSILPRVLDKHDIDDEVLVELQKLPLRSKSRQHAIGV